jgi:hypothetical protein
MVKRKTAHNYAGHDAEEEEEDEEESVTGGGRNEDSTQLPSFFLSTWVFKGNRVEKCANYEHATPRCSG